MFSKIDHMPTNEAAYYLAANGVPVRSYDATPRGRSYASMDKAFGLKGDDSFELVF